MKIGQIIYHKLTNEPLLIIEDIEEDYKLEETETIECRYQDDHGIYHSEEFYGAEVIEKLPVIPNYPQGGGGGGGPTCRCGGNCGGGGGSTHPHGQ